MSAVATSHGKRHAITPRQIKAIHAAIHKVGLDDAAYRLRLKSYGANTCKDLTWQQAEELLDSLNGKGAQGSGLRAGGKVSTPNTEPRTQSRQQYADLDGRSGFASGAQCRLLAAMFAQITWVAADDPERREKALNGFCHRIAGVAGLRMVRTFQVQSIVKALEAMGAEHKDKGGKS